MKIENKVVPSYASEGNGERCHVYLLDLYIKKVTREVVHKDVFFSFILLVK